MTASQSVSYNINPFPATAVARLARPEGELWSIETDALKQARIQLESYLEKLRVGKDSNAVSHGMVIAIVGDYGTGKTHIAQDMLSRIAKANDPKLHPLYLDAPSDSFLALYKGRFIEKLNRQEVVNRVDGLYAEIVAAELERSAVTLPLVKAMQERNVNPDVVIKRLGIMEAPLLRDLGKRLREITSEEDFAIALLLLRRIEFQPAVWEWLSGGAPDPILRERGIRIQIDSDKSAMEAMGVMSFLFGLQGHSFIVFIDEMEKVFSQSSTHRLNEAAILAFKKLMETVSQTGALLVIMGLPECLEILPEDARQRISSTIRPSAIRADEIEKYVRQANIRIKDSDTLEPFTKDAIEYLAEIAGGNARKVMRLCYHAYLAATETENTNLSRATLREIAREQFELNPATDVIADIVRCIESKGWLYEREKTFKQTSKHKIDFWLPVGNDLLGIALFISSSILQVDEVDLYTKKIKEIAKSRNSSAFESVLIVNGYLADNLRKTLNDVFTKVIIYRARDFREDLEASLNGMRLRLQEKNSQSELQQVKATVEQIYRQNSIVESQLSRLSEYRITPETVNIAVSSGIRSVFGQLASNTFSDEAHYPHLSARFDSAKIAVERVSRINELWELAFGFSVGESAEHMKKQSDKDSSELYSLVQSLELGRVSILLNSIAAFRAGIVKLLSNFAPSSSLFASSTTMWATDSKYGILGRMCRSFDMQLTLVDYKESILHCHALAEKFFADRGERRIAKAYGALSELSMASIDGTMRSLQSLGHDVWKLCNDLWDDRKI